ncbi:TonB-dependent hemoglobin/transferrin/lactoferrin family receptor [Crenobacter cavernae]|uniref:TonB-dependent hemoglobin/transferrin/lactoferrin family receptor n=1 Tax=Crenobacter cavernae TaxID=2290923 RepID=A0A345Y823_9NEIS|nr:TonB-dependent hemoglobin/transferrin/lactoferrin family receptor [Crenobacter cavernae]AXK40075.1 TonB-dependent hemoglobin/transferrin/lactoferrin family receptor [Crenobacter cavernae]
MPSDRLFVAGLCLTASLPALADTSANLSPDLPVVTVTATRTATPLEKAAPNISVIGQDTLSATTGGHLEDLFRYEPGVSVNNDPTRRGNGDLIIRGMSGNRILTQVDGVRMPDVYSANKAAISGRDLVEPWHLEQVEIARGPISSLFGANAMGGLVRFETLSPEGVISAEKPVAGLVRGAFGDGSDATAGHARLAVGDERWAALFAHTQRREHEADNFGTDDSQGSTASTARTRPNPATIRTDSTLAKLQFKPAAGHRVELTLDQYHRRNDTEVHTSRSATVNDFDADDSNRRDRVSLGYRYVSPDADSGLTGASAQLYHQTLDNHEKTRENRSGNTVTRFDDNRFAQRLSGFDGQLEWRHAFGDVSHKILAGLELSRTDTERLRDRLQVNNLTGATTKVVAGETYPQKSFPDTQTQAVGAFVQDEIGLGRRWTLIPGLRWDGYRMTPQPDALSRANQNRAPEPGKLSDSAFSPRLATSFKTDDHWTLFASAGMGFRMPPFDAVTNAFINPMFGYELRPNANLEPERSTGIELGAKAGYASFDLALNLFATRYRNFIDNVQLAGATPSLPGVAQVFQAQNLDKVETRGVELNGAWRFAPGFTLRNALSIARGDVSSANRPLDSIAPPTLVTGLRYDYRNVSIEPVWTLVAKKKRVSNDAYFKAPGYGRLDLLARWQVNKHVTTRLNLSNVTDQKHWNWADVAQRNNGATIALYSAARRAAAVSVDVAF